MTLFDTRVEKRGRTFLEDVFVHSDWSYQGFIATPTRNGINAKPKTKERKDYSVTTTQSQSEVTYEIVETSTMYKHEDPHQNLVARARIVLWPARYERSSSLLWSFEKRPSLYGLFLEALSLFLIAVITGYTVHRDAHRCLSNCANVAGIAKAFQAKVATIGNLTQLSLHHGQGSLNTCFTRPYLPIFEW